MHAVARAHRRLPPLVPQVHAQLRRGCAAAALCIARRSALLRAVEPEAEHDVLVACATTHLQHHAAGHALRLPRDVPAAVGAHAAQSELRRLRHSRSPLEDSICWRRCHNGRSGRGTEDSGRLLRGNDLVL